MHLISPLISGMAGAENGTAEIYVRGTASLATYYMDFEGGSPVTTGAAISLDANGRAEVYVNQLVTVMVRDLNGVLVTEFVSGYAASGVELISSSFSGTSYSSGAVALGNPTTVQAALDGWITSAGAGDFQVLLNGTDTNIDEAIFSLGGTIFNVKDPAYGATGDGSTDDTAAIAACSNAAAGVSGGVMYFPNGTYKTSSSITLGQGITLIGSGGNCVVNNTHATASTFVCQNSTLGVPQLISGIRFTATSTTGPHISVESAAASVVIERCAFAQGSGASSLITVNHASAVVTVRDCHFAISTAAGTGITLTLARRVSVSDSRFVVSEETWNNRCITTASNITADLAVDGCYFDVSSVTTTSGNIIYSNQGSGLTSVTNCVFSNLGDTGLSVACIGGTSPGSTGDRLVYESGNKFGTDNSASAPTAYGNFLNTTNLGQWHTRDKRLKQTADSGSANLSLDGVNYGTQVVKQNTSGAAQALIVTKPNHEGACLTLIYWNDTGAVTGTITFDATTFRPDTATFTVNANSATAFQFMTIATGTGVKWVQVAARHANFAE